MVKLFAHRGFHSSNIPQNSIASLEEAHKNHFHGIEFDIWFLDGKLILKHDEPSKKEINNLPTLRDYFSFKNEFTYWMDFKNLNEKNAEIALRLVKKDVDEAAINLDQIYFAPFIADYEIAEKIFRKIRNIFGKNVNLVAVCKELGSAKKVKILRDFLTKNNVKFLSIFHQLLDENFVKKFSKTELFAWTVNDLARIEKLRNLGVKNFATDKITPQIYDRKT
jgi:glycerophosphoryl diester phosphodiesterase